MARDLRLPPPQAAFNGRQIPVCDLGGELNRPWYRLCRVEYPSQFFPSKGSRLTPSSGAFPCVYLAGSKETTVAEVWGDRLAALRDAGETIYAISRGQAERWAYLQVDELPNDLRVCDLLDLDTRMALGLDSASLYAPDLALPQEWAERVARHPAGFDGIRYRSRHTDEACLVLWSGTERCPPLEERLEFAEAGSFLESDAAYILAGKVGVRLAFAW